MNKLQNKKNESASNRTVYGTGLALLGVAPITSATLVDLQLDPNSVGFNSGQYVGLLDGTQKVGSFYQFNDATGKTFSALSSITNYPGATGFAFFNRSETITSNFIGTTYLTKPPSATGTAFVGFTLNSGEHGYIHVDFGIAGGPVSYLGAVYDNSGAAVHIPVPEPSSLALLSLSLLAAGASGVRKLRHSNN